jgi:hypothetical protein
VLQLFHQLGCALLAPGGEQRVARLGVKGPLGVQDTLADKLGFALKICPILGTGIELEDLYIRMGAERAKSVEYRRRNGTETEARDA